MIKLLSSASVMLLLVGCAGMPKPQTMPHKAPIVKAAPAPATPNVVIKKRWFNGHAIKLFH